VLKILLDNGAQSLDRHLVLNTAAGANIRGKQGGKANEAGTDQILRNGVLLDIHGFAIRESAQINTSTAGHCGFGATNAAGYAVGATVITLASAGTGTLVAGDVVTFAGDTNKYVVETGDATRRTAAPSRCRSRPSRCHVGSDQGDHRGCRGLAQHGVHPRCDRAGGSSPGSPEGRRSRGRRDERQDPLSGLAFEIAQYNQYRQVQFEVSCAWGVKVVKAENLALLLG
jgi:hypothetical protein